MEYYGMLVTGLWFLKSFTKISIPFISFSIPIWNLRSALSIFMDSPQGGIPNNLITGVVLILQISLLFLVNKNIGLRNTMAYV